MPLLIKALLFEALGSWHFLIFEHNGKKFTMGPTSWKGEVGRLEPSTHPESKKCKGAQIFACPITDVKFKPYIQGWGNVTCTDSQGGVHTECDNYFPCRAVAQVLSQGLQTEINKYLSLQQVCPLFLPSTIAITLWFDPHRWCSLLLASAAPRSVLDAVRLQRHKLHEFHCQLRQEDSHLQL